MKELNKKEAIGDLLDAFTEVFYPAGWIKASRQTRLIFVFFRSRSVNLLLRRHPLRPTPSLMLRRNLPQRLQMRPGKRRKTNTVVNPMGLNLPPTQLARNPSPKKVVAPNVGSCVALSGRHFYSTYVKGSISTPPAPVAELLNMAYFTVSLRRRKVK